MAFAEHYFKRHAYPLPDIQEPPTGLLSYIVVIPVYREEKLLDTLKYIQETELPAGKSVEIILVFNHPENDTPENKKLNQDSYHNTIAWSKRNNTQNRQFRPVILGDLSKKHAGPGLARKVGMDIALQRFQQINNPHGFILSLDADTRIQVNYFTALNQQLQKQPNVGGCIFYFEHPTTGSEYPAKTYEAITQYELHLRYYKQALNRTEFPHANYTIGSCFGVRADVYAKHGGMNRQKAGEDFYFLNKLFPHEEFAEVTSTCVMPSPRPSDRVVFGTGPVIQELTQMEEPTYMSYNPQCFEDLKQLFSLVPKLFDPENENELFNTLPAAMQSFLIQNQWQEKLREIRKNTSGLDAFVKRFFLWFDGFRVVKFLNYGHESAYSKIPVTQACEWLLSQDNSSFNQHRPKELLTFFRAMDRERKVTTSQ